MKKWIIALALAITLTACKTVYVPVETNTSTNVKDSVEIHIKDSLRITERSRYKDYGRLLDTLRVDGKRSHSKSWIDTTFNILNNELVEDPIEEKTKIITKTEYKDSVRTVEKEVPYPVETVTEKRVYPRWLVILSILGIVETAVLGVIGYLRLKSSGLFSKIIRIFKK